MLRLICIISLLVSVPFASGQNPAIRGEQVIPLSLCAGSQPTDLLRPLMVPVECNGHKGLFELGAYGRTRISESFAKSCGIQPGPDEFGDAQLDPDGNPVYAGGAPARLKIAETEELVNALIVTDDHCQKSEKQGVIGGDALWAFQWEVDPGAMTLTLRPPATPPKHKPLAILDTKAKPYAWYIRVRVRNASEEIAISPGSSFVQAGPKLQKAWDLNSGKALDLDVKQFGNVRVFWLHGQDDVELTKNLKETDLPVCLMGDPKHPEKKVPTDSGLGQCVLNRYVYCIEPKRQQFRLMARVKAPQTQPELTGGG